MSAHGTKHVLRDLFLYMAIGGVVVGLAVYVGVRQAHASEGSNFPVRWIFLAAETALVFGYVLRAFWRFRKQRRFWLTFAGILAAHIAIAVRVLSQLHSNPPLLLLSLFCPLEYFAVSFVLLAILRPSQGQ